MIHRFRNKNSGEEKTPAISKWLQSGFHLFLESYLRRNFDGIGIESISGSGLDSIPRTETDFPTESESNIRFSLDAPLIIYANHPSWWDPMIAQFLNRKLFPNRQFYAPIDAKALEHYRVLGKLGFYGIELGTSEGIKNFLRLSTAIARTPSTAIWMTPEGKFTDAQDFSSEWMPGLGHLCQRLQAGYVIPLALEYSFWNEPRPLCLASLGQPTSIRELSQETKQDCNQILENNLRDTQKRLRSLVVSRDPKSFSFLNTGHAGPKGIYGHARKLASLLSGHQLRKRHGDHLK